MRLFDPKAKSFAAAAAALVLASFSGEARAADPLLMAADVGFAPFIMQKADGSYWGHNVDLGAEIAKRLKRPGYKIINQEWAGIFVGLNAKKYDMIIAPTSITLDRSKNLLFTEGYMDNDWSFLIKKGAPEIARLEDLKGKTVSVVKGNVFDQWLTQNQGQYGWEIARYGKDSEAAQALLSGRDNAFMTSVAGNGWAVRQNPMFVNSYVITREGAVGAVFRKDDVALRNEVERAIECMKIDGTMARLYKEWIGRDPRPGSFTVTPVPGYGPQGMEGHDATPHENKCG
ncbi:MAG: transporter substrate-binding domain-containing protein [Proteobacteria bacterium]|nr:transporter substrate-binding domain-containing protein [Pseudomonadota bacterium]